jgi:hypothetical protein
MITSIEITFGRPVELTNSEERRLAEIASEISDRYTAKNPGRTMWPFGVGQKMLTNPLAVADGEPLEFDSSCFSIECHEREDFKWPCRKCGHRLDGHAPYDFNPEAGSCEYDPAAPRTPPDLKVVP